MKKLSTLIVLALVMVACSNDNKAKDIATDVCACFEPVTGDMSSKTKKILVKAFNSDSPDEVITSELEKIDDEDQKAKVQQEMQGIATIGDNSKVEKCVKKLEKKYKFKKTDKKLAKQITDEMQDVSDCDVAAALMTKARLQESGEDEEETTDEETTEDEEKKSNRNNDDEESEE